MKIQAANLSATPATGGPLRNVDRMSSSSVQGTRGAVLTPTDVDRIDVGGDLAGGLSPEERLDRLASRFEARLDHLMEREGLTDAQRAALEQAKTDFGKLVDRLSNALDTLDPGVAARSFQLMVDGLRDSVHATLTQRDGDADPAGDGDPAGGERIDPAGGLPRGDVTNIGRTGGDLVDERGSDALDSLDEVKERFASRFEAFLSKEGLDEGVAQELLAASQEFEGLLDRLHEAFSNGDKDVSFLRAGFQTALADLREELAAIFAGSRDDHGKPEPLLRADSVAIYQADGGSDPLGRPRNGGFDHIV